MKTTKHLLTSNSKQEPSFTDQNEKLKKQQKQLASRVPYSTWKIPGLTLTPSAATASVVHQLHQFWIDGLISFFQHFDQLSSLL